MVPDIVHLRRFGLGFLGPMMASFFTWLGIRLSECDSKKLYFLAREGYFLSRFFIVLQKSGFWTEYEPVYLLTSRASMMRISLARPQLRHATINSAFSGSLRRLLNDKLLLSHDEINALSISQDLDFTHVQLPRDKLMVSRLLKRNDEVLSRLTDPAAVAYEKYLTEIALTEQEKFLVVDLGFSGTIQKMLSILTQKPSTGFYFATTHTKEDTSDVEIQRHGCFFSDRSFGEGISLIDKSLYLEALLTGPDGQFMQFRNPDIMNAEYSSIAKGQRFFFLLEAIASGVEEYLTKPSTLKAIETGEAATWTDWVARAYEHHLADKSFLTEFLRSVFEVDDRGTGTGFIAVDSFLG